MKSLLPETIDVWKTANADQAYLPGNLYEYINGGAELYLSYQFQKSYSRIYQAKDQPDITIDIFDMSNSFNAYGVFMHGREQLDSITAQIGQGSETNPGMTVFWKDRYFISILAYPETDPSKQAVSKLAHQVSNSIPGTGPQPEILQLLPDDSKIIESIRYFKHHAWLNSHYFISNKNILLIEDNCHAALARYESSQKKPLLVIVKYPDAIRARQSLDHFCEAYSPEMISQPAVLLEDNSWLANSINGKYVCLVFNAHDRMIALDLLEQFEEKYDQFHKNGG